MCPPAAPRGRGQGRREVTELGEPAPDPPAPLSPAPQPRSQPAPLWPRLLRLGGESGVPSCSGLPRVLLCASGTYLVAFGCPRPPSRRRREKSLSDDLPGTAGWEARGPGPAEWPLRAASAGEMQPGLRNAALAPARWGQGAGCAGRRLLRNAARLSGGRAGPRATAVVSSLDAPHPYPAAAVEPSHSPSPIPARPLHSTLRDLPGYKPSSWWARDCDSFFRARQVSSNS